MYELQLLITGRDMTGIDALQAGFLPNIAPNRVVLAFKKVQFHFSTALKNQ